MIDRLREALSAELGVDDTLKWLREVYLPVVRDGINGESSSKRRALYEGEKIRNNEQNLSDTRTRMGLLLECEFARISNDLLADEGIGELFWSYVPANRYPDLVVRDDAGIAHLRVEMKALESCAEEKSANFETLIKDINPATDYLAVCLWEWEDSRGEEAFWDKTPIVDNIYVFHAYSLARIRDSHWLNSPQKSKYPKGIDLRTAISCDEVGFSVEQHNMGKMLRLWKNNGTEEPPSSFTERERETLKDYLEFVNQVGDAGFEYNARQILSFAWVEGMGKEDIEKIGFEGDFWYVSRGRAILPKGRKRPAKTKRLSELEVTVVVEMGKNYKCSVSRFENEKLVPIDEQIKPKEVKEAFRRMGLTN